MSGHRHQHDGPSRYTFDEVGIPYDFEESDKDLPVDGSSSSTTDSKRSSDESAVHLDTEEDGTETTESILSRTLRARPRLDGRLQTPREADHCVWKSRDDSWIPCKSSAGPSSYRVPSTNLHKFETIDRRRDLSANTDRLLNNLYSLKLRGRVDGRIFSSELQTQWVTSPHRRSRSRDAYEFKIPSYHEHDKVNRQLCDILPKPPPPAERRNSVGGMLDQKLDMRPYLEDAVGHEDSGWPNPQLGSDSESSFGNSSRKEKENPLKLGNRVATSSPQKNEVHYRGRLDGRLFTPEETEIQVTFVCTGGSPKTTSPHQELTYNESLGLDHRLSPQSVNIVQVKGKDNPVDSSCVRSRTDGRLHALQREANWAVQNQKLPSHETSDHQGTHRIWRPCRIQEVFEKTLPHSVEKTDNRPEIQKSTSDEFPSSYDPDSEAVSNVESRPTSEMESKMGSDAFASSSGTYTEESGSESLPISSTSSPFTIHDVDRPRARKERRKKQSPTHIIYRV